MRDLVSLEVNVKNGIWLTFYFVTLLWCMCLNLRVCVKSGKQNWRVLKEKCSFVHPSKGKILCKVYMRNKIAPSYRELDLYEGRIWVEQMEIALVLMYKGKNEVWTEGGLIYFFFEVDGNDCPSIAFSPLTYSHLAHWLIRECCFPPESFQTFFLCLFYFYFFKLYLLVTSSCRRIKLYENQSNNSSSINMGFIKACNVDKVWKVVKKRIWGIKIFMVFIYDFLTSIIN